jgi:hypothetical protein
MVVVPDPEIYINDCCWGGDLIRDDLLPLITSNYEAVMTAQEDWGWFIWFRRGAIRLALDIFCDSPARGEFRIRLTSRKRKFLVIDRIEDTEELAQLRDLVRSNLSRLVDDLQVQRVEGTD